MRLTQNPAALVSALRRIEGRSVIPGLAAGQDAMMIDGAHEGAFATHPTIAERVAAIVSVTGSMALIAPARRDTGQPGCAPEKASADDRRLSSRNICAPRGRARMPRSRASPRDSEFNRLGLTREMTVGAVAAVGVFLWVHSADLRNPAALVGAFDPAPCGRCSRWAGNKRECQRQGIGSGDRTGREAGRLQRVATRCSRRIAAMTA